jgi:flavin reductase (DIM6/NTAB) family NADH-FMN oxidoreductase RutF
MKQRDPIPAEGWVEKNIREFPGAPAARIGDEWALLSAASAAGWNTMTVSWGGLGVLWSRDAAFVFVRPSRYTFDFINAAPLFTLSFFDKSRHKALEFCGAHSGRDTDKAAGAALTPVVFGGAAAGAVAFKEASEVIVCRKLYAHDFDPAAFLEAAIDRDCYPRKDYHRMFIGEVAALLVPSDPPGNS